MFNSNNEVEYGQFVHAIVNISNTSFLDNGIDSSFYISKSTVSFLSSKFIKDSRQTYRDSQLLDIEESYVQYH